MYISTLDIMLETQCNKYQIFTFKMLTSLNYVTRSASNNNCYIAGVFPATANPFIGYFMVTWRLTMKLFPAKCHERATLRKLWRQTGYSSLLPAKCRPLLHVIAGISAQFSNFAFGLFCYITNHLMTGVNFVSLDFVSGNKIHCSPRDQSLSVNY